MTKAVMITGAARGIGRATVDEFLDHGWQVIAVDIRQMADAGAGVSAEICDVSDPAAVQALMQRLGEAEVPLRAVVNNAAIQWAKPVEETGMEAWDRVLSTNLGAAYDVCRGAHALLRANGGAIVNVSSVHAISTRAGRAAYAASKGGLVALTRALALEFASDGIRVNALLPGAVDTDMLREGFEHEAGKDVDAARARQELASEIPLGRVARPQEIARAIHFLSEESQASFITGQTLIVDGGATAKLSTA